VLANVKPTTELGNQITGDVVALGVPSRRKPKETVSPTFARVVEALFEVDVALRSETEAADAARGVKRSTPRKAVMKIAATRFHICAVLIIIVAYRIKNK